MALNGRASTAPATIDGHGPRHPRNLMSAPSTTVTPSTSRSAVDEHAPGQPRPRGRRALGGSRTATAAPLLDSRTPRSTRPPSWDARGVAQAIGRAAGRAAARLPSASSSAHEASMAHHRLPTRRPCPPTRPLWYVIVRRRGDRTSSSKEVTNSPLPWLSRVVIFFCGHK